VCENYTLRVKLHSACGNHTLRIEINLVRGGITLVHFVITFMPVVITLRVDTILWVLKLHSACKDRTQFV
jgi:hypothetical protein